MIKVLDKGYVRLVDKLGDDRTVINAARVSFNKQSDSFDEKDERLIKFLAEAGHDSPFRHAVLQFEIYQPMMVTRQFEKYLIGSNNSEFGARNESSRRYITEKNEFYIPDYNQWRSYPKNVKQGSGKPLDDKVGESYTQELEQHLEASERLYQRAMNDGVAPEQARLFLPAYGMYVRWYWTASLQTVAHMIKQRTASDAQHEFRVLAEAIKELAVKEFPETLGVLLDE